MNVSVRLIESTVRWIFVHVCFLIFVALEVALIYGIYRVFGVL